MRLAYADPPYPGKAALYPERKEVEHGALIRELETYDGWALSTDERALYYVLGLCRAGVRVCVWACPNDPPFNLNPIPSTEFVLMRPARAVVHALSPRNYLVSEAPNGHRQKAGELIGQKTPVFCEWVFRCLGAEPGDTLADLFPGTGIVGETWRRFEQQPTLPLRMNRKLNPTYARAQLDRSHVPMFEDDSSRPQGLTG